MTDDHGAWATGAYGCSSLHTPNIDALAKNGVRFTRAFAATPVCSPSRLTYMTGTLPSAHHVQDWLTPPDSFGPAAKRWLQGFSTYANLLAGAGYDCGLAGKWHMGQDEKAQEGFRYWATVPGGGGTYKDAVFVRNGETLPKPGFKEDAIGDFALEFLETHRQQHAAQPFFLLVPFYAPHTPLDFQPEQDRAPYAEGQFPCFPNAPRHPWINKGMVNHLGNSKSMLGYSALITAADRQIGRLLTYLEQHNLRADTTIVFTADQGWNAGHHGFWGKGNGTWPFNLYEESIRVPLIWNHPGRIASGKVETSLVSSYDFFPTLLEYAGLPTPPKDPRRVGSSYVSLLRAGAKPSKRNELFFEYSMVRGLRTHRFKLILRTDGFASELYDLENDPGETTNLFDNPQHTALRQQLTGRLERFFAATGAPPLPQWKSTTSQILTTYEAAPPR